VIILKKIIIFVLILLIPIKVKAYETSATSAILMDIDSNRIYYSKNIHEVRSVASISKIMTCILAIESGKLFDVVTIGDEINSSYGSGIYIKKDEQLKLIDLLYGLMLRSGNDAALAIANYVSDDFITLMNKKAKEIGMKNTKFNNPSGLDINGIGNYSTAYDMAILTSYAMKNDIYRQIVSTKKYSLKTNKNTYLWINKNKLLHRYNYITGGKTGFTDIARRTLVTTASNDNVNLVAVTLNDGNDFEDHINLFKDAFNEYKNYKVLSKGEIKIVSDKMINKQFFIEEDFYYTLNDVEKENIIIKINLDKENILGDLEVYLYDKVIYKTNLIIKEKETKTKLQKIIDWIKNIW